MNYIWDMLIKAEKAGIEKEDITFVKAKVYSPYMELAFEDINAMLLDSSPEIEINPYYRFFKIFKNLYDPDYEGEEELRNVLFDLLIHHLADTDAYMGMNKQEFYKRFILEDIRNGCFGSELKAKFKLFDDKEQQILLSRIIQQYQLGESLQLLKETIHLFYRYSNIYLMKQEKDEVLIYLGEKNTKEESDRLHFLLDFFLPVKYNIRIYWEHHFGVLEVQNTMKMDGIVLY